MKYIKMKRFQEIPDDYGVLASLPLDADIIEHNTKYENGVCVTTVYYISEIEDEDDTNMLDLRALDAKVTAIYDIMVAITAAVEKDSGGDDHGENTITVDGFE